jgi:hypothetical protein
MPSAICENCGSLVEAELTHNGICAVGHYVHCGWGHQLSPDELISDDTAEIIAKLEAKLAENEARLGKAVELALEECPFREGTGSYNDWWHDRRATLAEIKGDSHE